MFVNHVCLSCLCLLIMFVRSASCLLGVDQRSLLIDFVMYSWSCLVLVVLFTFSLGGYNE